MTVEDRWQDINELVRKKERTRSEGERLHEHVVALLTTPEGQGSIRKRLEEGGFDGRDRFIEEVVWAFDRNSAALSALSPRERSDFQRFVYGKTKRNQPSHWNLLWVLHRDGWNGLGALVIDSLTKGVTKKDDLAVALWSLPAWKGLAQARAVALLEAAREAASDFDLRGRINRALDWAKAPQPGMLHTAPADRTSPPPERARSGSECKEGKGSSADRPGQAAEPLGRTEETGSSSNARTPALASVAREADRFHAAPAKPGPSEAAPNQDAIAACVPLPDEPSSALQAIHDAIQQLYGRLLTRLTRLEGERDALRGQESAAGEEMGKLDAERRSLKEELERERENSRELQRERSRLEERRFEHGRELAAARIETRRLQEELTQAQQEIEDVRRRADDWIHEANLARDNSERSLQSRLWERLHSSFIDIRDEPAQSPNPDSTQEIFLHRLREIRDALRELGVPPH